MPASAWRFGASQPEQARPLAAKGARSGAGSAFRREWTGQGRKDAARGGVKGVNPARCGRSVPVMDERREENEPETAPHTAGVDTGSTPDTDRNTEEADAGGEPLGEDAPTGGDEATEDQLDADNAVEEDMIKTLDPGAPPA